MATTSFHAPARPATALITTLAMVLLAPGSLHAQVVTRPSDCAERLTAATSLPQSASAAQIRAALSSLTGCYPETDYALASMMRRAAGNADAAVLGLVFGPRGHADTATVHAALDVAGGPSSTPVARVYAFGALLSALDQSATPRYAELTSVLPGQLCSVRQMLGQVDSLVIAPSLEASIHDLARATAAAPGEMLSVRSAAFCVLSEWRIRHGLPWIGFLQDPATEVSIAAQCDALYMVSNSSEFFVTVMIDAPGVWAAREVDLPARHADGSPGSAYISVPNASQVRVLHDGVPFATAQPPSQGCGSE